MRFARTTRLLSLVLQAAPQTSRQGSPQMSRINISSEPAEEFICPISLEVMTSPVKILTTGRVYDNGSLQTWFSQGGSICPLTGTKLEFPLTLRPQTRLRAKIDAWAAENGITLPPAVYGKPERPTESGTFVTKQKGQNRILQSLRGFGSFLVSKRPFDCQIL